MNEIIYWGGPKDGHIQHQTSVPPPEVYCVDDTSELLDLFDVYSEKNRNPDAATRKLYSVYKIKKISKGKYKYIFNGLL